MKKVLLFLLVILSFQITAKEEEVRIWYQNGILTEVGITIEEIVDLKNIKIDEKNKTEIEMKNYKFYVNKNDYSQYENEKRKDFSGYIYEKLIYSKDLNDKIVIPDWRYHYSGVKKNNKSKNDIEANGNKKISERQEKIEKFTEEAKKYPGKKFKFRINE